MKITGFTRENLRALNAELYDALKPVAAKHGIVVKPGNITFDTLSFKTKFEFAVTETASGVSGAEATFRRDIEFSAMKPEHFGREFLSRDQRFKIVGFKRGVRLPVIAARADGKRFRFAVSDVIARLI